jgi:hypothetical protein
MSASLVPQRLLFRFAARCLYRRPLWTPEGAKLEERYRLPSFAQLEGRREFAEIRAAWSEEGLAFTVRVVGKLQAPWCRASRPEDSDGLQLWLDTRDVHDVHRAGRFCHRFIFLPSGGGSRLDQPLAGVLPIHRARENPRPVNPRRLAILAMRTPNGYLMEAFIAAEALSGYDPQEHPRLGFTYAVLDRELGEQTFGPGSPMPYQEDPSLWPTLELVNISRA